MHLSIFPLICLYCISFIFPISINRRSFSPSNYHQCIYSAVSTVAFHPEGQCISSGSADKSIKMWDVRSHMLIQHYAAHSEEVTSISMHPSGYYLLSASKDATMKIWDLREGRLLFTLKGMIVCYSLRLILQRVELEK